MKKILLFTAVILTVILSGCSNEFEPDVQPSDTASDVVIPQTRVVSEEQALAFVEKAIAAMEATGDTVLFKVPTSRTIKEVESVKTQSGVTALYVVNFEDEQGYMVLSADKEAQNPMLSFNTNGNFDINEIEKESAVGKWLEEGAEKFSEAIKSGIHADNKGYQLWEYVIDSDEYEVTVEIADYEEFINAQDGNNTQTRGTHGTSSGRNSISPWYDVQYNVWGQGNGANRRGYNADAKIPNYHLAGCPAVAIGLLCKTHDYPSTYDYWNMPQSINTTSSNAISRMFRDIADKIPSYFWDTPSNGGSGATPAGTLTGLKALGYSQAKTKAFDAWTAYADIKDWYPVLLYGWQTPYGGGGHIWIADGYYEQVWKYTKTKKFLGMIISKEEWYEYMDTFYMNWGWDGQGNGWVDVEDWNSSVNGSFNNGKGMFYDLIPQ